MTIYIPERIKDKEELVITKQGEIAKISKNSNRAWYMEYIINPLTANAVNWDLYTQNYTPIDPTYTDNINKWTKKINDGKLAIKVLSREIHKHYSYEVVKVLIKKFQNGEFNTADNTAEQSNTLDLLDVGLLTAAMLTGATLLGVDLAADLLEIGLTGVPS